MDVSSKEENNFKIFNQWIVIQFYIFSQFTLQYFAGIWFFFFLLQFIVIFFIVHETWMLCN